MRHRLCYFGIAFGTALVLSPSLAQAQTAQNRIPQQIVINGQNASGAYVTTAGGQIQSYTCPSPQQYTTADGSSRGWACYEQTTGVWLLSAVPPAQAQPAQAPVPVPVPAAPPQVVLPQQQPAVVYQQAPPVVIYEPQPATIVYQPAVVYPPQRSTVIVQEPAPTVIYAPAPRPVIVAPTYPSSVIIGKAAIEAAGRVASAVILSSGHSREYVSYNYYDYGRDRRYDRGRSRR
jgi:hypothetical protein